MARTSRESETRENTSRTSDSWRPASILPTPAEEPGYRFRYVRTSILGDTDAKNVSTRFREKWEPVRAEDYKDLEVLPDPTAKFEGSVEIGGLVLCKTAAENVERRNDYFAQRNQAQMEAVDNSFLKSEDRRMPLHSERRSRTTFGSGQ